MKAAWVVEQDACSETALLVGHRKDRVAHPQGREMVEHKNVVAP